MNTFLSSRPGLRQAIELHLDLRVVHLKQFDCFEQVVFCHRTRYNCTSKDIAPTRFVSSTSTVGNQMVLTTCVQSSKKCMSVSLEMQSVFPMLLPASFVAPTSALMEYPRGDAIGNGAWKRMSPIVPAIARKLVALKTLTALVAPWTSVFASNAYEAVRYELGHKLFRGCYYHFNPTGHK